MLQRVQVVPYDSSWPSMFETEAKRLKGVLGKEAVSIHHIGSTAIPGISAKPIIDILPEVVDIQKIDGFNGEMVKLGYTPRGELGIPGRRFFSKDAGDIRTHHVHIFQTGSSELQRHLDFRDYLIARPKKARAYGRLKEALARKFPEDIEGYTDGKDGFIKDMERKAKEWRSSRPQ
ncbi:MAG: GrpB family protein [Dehalococcoidia bacterium]